MARVLVVDDEPIVRELLVDMLALLGHEADEAASGVEALALFDEAEYDLVLSDVMMPDMNGFDLLAQLQPRTGDRVPVVILSSHDDPDGIEAAIYAGAFDYLLKPFDGPRVSAIVERALEERRARTSTGT